MTPGDPKTLGALAVPPAPSTASTATATGNVFCEEVRTTALRVFFAFLPLRTGSNRCDDARIVRIGRGPRFRLTWTARLPEQRAQVAA